MPDGTLELVGRCDFMVKIRGYSVVLGAVEAALSSHQNISTAVVITDGQEVCSGDSCGHRGCYTVVPMTFPSGRRQAPRGLHRA